MEDGKNKKIKNLFTKNNHIDIIKAMKKTSVKNSVLEVRG
jgi:hypothetical protein